LNAFPKADTEVCVHYPLYLAYDYRQSEKNLVLQLLKEFPQAATEKYKNGWHPLHLVLCQELSENVVLQLQKEF
jgi:hypothetical protein